MSTLRQSLTPADLKAAIDMACDRRELMDQKGRRWARWYAAHSSCAATCAKCGKRIDMGYCLVGNVEVKICPSHVERRWV